MQSRSTWSALAKAGAGTTSRASATRTTRFRTARIKVPGPPGTLTRRGSGHLPDRCANASNWPRFPRREARQPVFCPVCACLNACDPCREAKLRRAAARSDPPAGPRSLPGAPVSQPCGARSCGSARDLPVREPARLGPAASWFPGSHEYSSEVLPAWQRRRAGRTPVMLALGIGGALTPSAAGLRGELGVRPGHDAGARLGAPAARAAARLQRAHAVERRRTVAAPAPRAPNAGAARGRVHRGGLAGGGAAAGAGGLAVARGGGAPERGPGRLGDPAAARRARAPGGPVRVLARRPARGGQEPRRPDRRVRRGRLRRGRGRARDPRNRAARGGAARAGVAARRAGGASRARWRPASSARCTRTPTCWRS